MPLYKAPVPTPTDISLSARLKLLANTPSTAGITNAHFFTRDGSAEVSEERVPLQEELGRVLRVVLGYAVALARAQAELRELERHVFPHRAVSLALFCLHICVWIVLFFGVLQVLTLGSLL